jgi:post-segregation antitoxin (ccd killing protein)
MSVRPKKYTEVITLKISETQKQTLDKMRGYNISVSRFIRDAIKEKIKREYQDLKPKIKEEPTPF